jgi:hypothetical protein
VPNWLEISLAEVYRNNQVNHVFQPRNGDFPGQYTYTKCSVLIVSGGEDSLWEVGFFRNSAIFSQPLARKSEVVLTVLSSS